MTQTLFPQASGLYVQQDGPMADPQQPMAFPLRHTAVRASVSGNISRVEVTQTFENPFATALEATYVFPLPDEAAVDTMTIRLGDRTIHGRIEKREEAQAIYQQAKRQGQTAGLLEQERANIFTQSLANIQPGEQIEVVITYSDQLPYKQDCYEFIFPMVVGPRYIPGNPIEDTGMSHGTATAPMQLNQDTDLVPDASRLNSPILPVGMRSGHDIQVTVDIETGDAIDGFQIANLHSPSHQIRVNSQRNAQKTYTRVTLAPGDTVPNKDLILRYQVAGESTQTSLLTQADERGGHFAIYLIPAIAYDAKQYIPKEMVFLIDTSGSQQGPPLRQCQALMRRFIEELHPQDTFNIVNFANTTQQLATMALPNTPHNRRQALKYVNGLRAGGGTQMLRGLKTVLNLPQFGLGRIRNVVLLTDGYIGNETQIFAEVQRSLPLSTRLHSFGAGSSVNRFLLNRVAEMGRGISHIVRHDEPIDTLVERFLGQINNPVLGNLMLQWDGVGETPDLYPVNPPDLFAEQPLVLFGRKGDRQPGTLRITGLTVNGKPFEQSFAIDFESSGNPAIAQLWGRARIKALMNQMVSGETTRGVKSVTQTALTYQLLSQYTAFVAVSDEVRVERPHESVAANVPVMMPEAISYEGVFGGLANMASAAPNMMTVRCASAASPPSPASSRPSKKRSQPIPASESVPPDEFDLTLISPSMMPEPGAGGFDDDATLMADYELADEALDEPMVEETKAAPKSAPLRSRAAASPRKSAASRRTSGIPQNKVGKILGGAYQRLKQSLQPTRTPRVKLIKANGLPREASQQLKQYLHMVLLENAQTGFLVFELVFQQGRIKRVMLDEEASDAVGDEAIAQIRQVLLTWPCPLSLSLSVQLKLQIQG